MNARKQAKYVKRLYVYETPFKAFAFKTAGLFALGSFSIYTILEYVKKKYFSKFIKNFITFFIIILNVQAHWNWKLCT